MMGLEVSIVSRRPGHDIDPVDEPQSLERPKRPIHRVEGNGRHPFSHSAIDRLYMGMHVTPGDLPGDFEPLMGQPQPALPQCLRKQGNATLHFALQNDHSGTWAFLEIITI